MGIDEIILLEHGSGGKASQRLLEEVFWPHFREVPMLDAAMLTLSRERLAFTTDSFVVDPIFFPGGDIGSLAVHGTVNDLAMVGARPLYLSAAFILEEGLPLADLKQVVASMARAALKAGVKIICGDTKVVPRGKGDKIFINTSGLGLIPEGIKLLPENISPGDRILVSGPIADHGLTILASRENLGLEGLESDSQALNHVVFELLSQFPAEIKALRDPTRGGLASVLHEFCEAAQVGIFLEEEAIPIRPQVKAGSEILGLDPLYLACEGRFVLACEPGAAEEIKAFLQGFPETRETAVIGEVLSEPKGLYLKTIYGGTRPVPPLSGEPLPRIC
ncbi:hydrogenase expression/formation protein HypE [Thermodesulfatator autotrophicus]|uniref:Hydrogenase expression/formation protein HypE n=1 Tax=Thermodesulfatator autotrophicus TaxID=1795632 RepID=A0A177E830_9BACT|nr:hydrogenase expression/formation protein HypE [Thermodesulfatator autotrophicus]OAG27651.1 hydrogenase expression/formation protein HypE [Thermodesulfatator autotrophicus]